MIRRRGSQRVQSSSKPRASGDDPPQMKLTLSAAGRKPRASGDDPEAHLEDRVGQE